MKNILSIEDIKRLYSKHKLIVILTTILTFVIYLIFALYNFYSATIIEETEERYQELSQAEIVEILNREPEDIIAEDLVFIQESLDANSVEFRVFMELEDQTPFNEPGLLKDFLVTEDVVSFVQQEAGTTIPIDTDLSVLVERRYGHPVLSIVLRTGDYEDNMALAEAYMTAIEEDIVPVLVDRNVYFLDEEPDFFEPRMITQILENMRVFSPMSIVIGTVFSLVAGFVLGSIIAILKGMKEDKINELSILQNNPNDKILLLYKLKTKQEINSQIRYAINYPPNLTKLVLTDIDYTGLKNEQVNNQSIEFVNDLSNADPNRMVDEVIILTKIDETSSSWYKNQRIQLENLTAQIKVIQI